MTIQQCKYVIEVEKMGSFNEASKTLFVSQTSISFGIKALEDELGIKIFKRTKKGVVLTSDGAEFIKYAKSITAQSDFVQKRYTSRKDMKKLYVSSQHYDFIAELFGNFLRENCDEGSYFSLVETKTHKVIEDVERNYSDIGIIAVKKDDDLILRYLKKKDLVFTPLIKTCPHVFLRKNHPLSDKKILKYTELKNYPYIFYEQDDNRSLFFAEELSDVTDSVRNVEISDRATLMNLIMLTDSYTIGTGIMNSELNNGNIIAIPLSLEDENVVGYITRKNEKTSFYLGKFIDALKAFADKYESGKIKSGNCK